MHDAHSLTLIKIWSGSSVDSERGALRQDFMERLARDVAALQRQSSRRFALVVSGAVATGRLTLEWREASELAKSDYAAAGQSRLFAAYAEAFGSAGLSTAEFLLQDNAARAWQALENSGHSERDSLLEALRIFEWRILADRIERCVHRRCVAIINHNDAMAGSERTDLRDNDLLAYRTIETIREHSRLAVARVVFLSNTRGVLDADGRTVRVARMERDDHAHHDRVFASLSHHITDEKSSVGTGGLASKLATARRLVRDGVAVTLACYRDSLTDILDDRSECTRLEFEECRD